MIEGLQKGQHSSSASLPSNRLSATERSGSDATAPLPQSIFFDAKARTINYPYGCLWSLIWVAGYAGHMGAYGCIYD